MSFPENLKRARLAKGKKQKEVADYLKVTPSTYCGYESGKRTPDLAKVQKIAQFLGVRIEDLMGLETFDSGAEFDAEWKRRTQNADGPGIEIRHKANGEIQVIDHQRERLIATYDNLDAEDQVQLAKFGDILAAQSKYDEKPPQD